MNCDTFLDLLHEYLDETLDADVASSARQHLQQCAVCRQALQREQILAKNLRLSMERATAGVSLRLQLRQNVLRALESNPAVSHAWWPVCRDFIFLRWRWVGPAWIVLAVSALFFGFRFHRTDAGPAVRKTAAPPAEYGCVISVPLQTQIHVFRQQNNTIEDAVISGAGLGYASFSDDR